MLANIKEITELKDYQEVNKRLKEEWQLLGISNKDNEITYILGRKEIVEKKSDWNNIETIKAHKERMKKLNSLEEQIQEHLTQSKKLYIGDGIIVEIGGENEQ
jgi:hypothetical protein